MAKHARNQVDMSWTFICSYIFLSIEDNQSYTECYKSCEFRAPEDFLKWRYNLLDMSVMRVAHYGLDSGFSACSRQHAWHSCRADCIVISENPQGLATHMVQ